MPEVHVSFSENLTGDNFKSRRFGVEIVETIPESVSVPQAIQTLFATAKREVQSQLTLIQAHLEHHAQAPVTPPPPPVHHCQTPPPPSRQQYPQGKNYDRPASAKQISCIFAIGKALNLSKSALEGIAGMPIANINSRDASDFIEHLKQRQAA
jgi:hypothetical protein